MKFVFIFGPPAVGKMTVGREIEKITGFRMFHNHMTVDLVKNLFDVENPSFGKLVEDLRILILTALANSNLPGVIFTAGLDFNEAGELAFVNKIESIFTEVGAATFYLELESSLDTRLERNKTPFRLEQKPTKRDIPKSDAILVEYDKSSRFNTFPGELEKKHYLKIENTSLSAEEVAKSFILKFGLNNWKLCHPDNEISN